MPPTPRSSSSRQGTEERPDPRQEKTPQTKTADHAHKEERYRKPWLKPKKGNVFCCTKYTSSPGKRMKTEAQRSATLELQHHTLRCEASIAGATYTPSTNLGWAIITDRYKTSPSYCRVKTVLNSTYKSR